MSGTAMTTGAPDLSGFLLAHRGVRAEFGRLAAAARQVRDPGHAALLDDQIELVMHLLHHHHNAEDTGIWPHIVSRAPEAKAALDRREAQHEDMDPRFTAVTDRSRSVADLARPHEVRTTISTRRSGRACRSSGRTTPSPSGTPTVSRCRRRSTASGCR